MNGLAWMPIGRLWVARLCNKLIVFIFAAVIPGYTCAMMTLTGLERYDYSELFLLRIVQLKDGSRAACFGTRDDKVVWVRRGDIVGWWRK
jgi:hypothetical protein